MGQLRKVPQEAHYTSTHSVVPSPSCSCPASEEEMVQKRKCEEVGNTLSASFFSYVEEQRLAHQHIRETIFGAVP